jgi:hypothetical protein
MENTADLKVACGYCGEILDLPRSSADRVVRCFKCGRKSQLQVSPPHEPVELPRTVPKPVAKCPDCGAVLNPQELVCRPCQSLHRKRAVALGLGSALVLLAIASIALVILNRPVKKKPPSIILISQAQPKPSKSINDLKVGRFSLQQTRGSNLILAVGDVQNTSDYIHQRVQVVLDVLDARGVKIGVVSGLINVLQPHASWHFLAKVSSPKAARVRFTAIKEDK